MSGERRALAAVALAFKVLCSREAINVIDGAAWYDVDPYF
jgi:hypothetical protein